MNRLDALLMKVSCQKFARHVASEQPIPGGFSMRFFFWVHWAVCPFCRRYWREIREIGAVQRTNAALGRHPAVQLPEVKARLKERLRRKAS